MKFFIFNCIIIIHSVLLGQNFNTDAEKVLKDNLKFYIKKDDVFKKNSKKLIVLNIVRYSEDLRIFDYSLSYIANDYEYELVHPMGYYLYKDHIVLVRTDSMNFSSSDISFISPMNRSNEEGIIQNRLNVSPRKARYTSYYLVCNMKNDSNFIVHTRDITKIDPKYSKYNPKYCDFPSLKEETISNEDLNKLLNIE